MFRFRLFHGVALRRTLRAALAAAAAVSSLGLHPSAVAAPVESSDAFVGPWAPSAVAESGILDGTTSVRHPIRFGYHVDLSDPGFGVSERYASFKTIAPESANLFFRWRYSGFHAYHLAFAKLVVWQKVGRAIIESTLFEGPVSGEFSITGFSAGLSLSAGQEWGIRVGGSNFDGTSLLDGTVDLEAAYQATPGMFDPLAWTSGGIAEGTTSVASNQRALSLGYAVDLGERGRGVGLRSATYTMLPKDDGVLSFDWSFDCFHAFWGALAIAEVSIDTPDGLVVSNLVQEIPIGFTNYMGSFSGNVYVGRPVIITLSGATLDSNSEIWGGFVLRNASLPLAPLPACSVADRWGVAAIAEGTSDIIDGGDPAEFLAASYDVDLSAAASGVTGRQATYLSTASSGGTVTLDWHYSGFHAYFLAYAQLVFFSGGQDLTVYDASVFGSFSASGAATFDVLPGETWGLRAGGGNFDSYSVLRGTVTITSLVTPTCPGDFDCNGEVNGSDLAVLLGSWGPCEGCTADVDGNGAVEGADLATLLGAWGGCG
ncbi:MAG: hypothetical protein JNL80_06555 [Phycisphaerae bacterium]|jgi:hypothetical protein|nr:hypothetical protein [Phycisphaerae bacterium]